MPNPPGRPHRDQRWSTFLKNHAMAILASDLFVDTGARFRMLTFRTAGARMRSICALGFEALRSSIPSAQVLGGWSWVPHSRDVQVTPTAAMHSPPIPPRLMTSSNGLRPQSALSPHVRDPPRSPARVSEVSLVSRPASVCVRSGSHIRIAAERACTTCIRLPALSNAQLAQRFQT